MLSLSPLVSLMWVFIRVYKHLHGQQGMQMNQLCITYLFGIFCHKHKFRQEYRPGFVFSFQTNTNFCWLCSKKY